MRVRPTALPGVVVVEPVVNRDPRGFFVETYRRDRFRDAGIDLPFVQNNHSRSVGPILRGLHLQRRQPQGKLVRVLAGEIFDVAVDVRRGSPTFARWIGERLSAESFHQLYVPPGFVHGFCVLSGAAEVEYKCTDLYAPDDELTIAWDDPQIGVEWPVAEPLLSKKDAAGRKLAEVLDLLPVYPHAAAVD